MTKTGHGKRHGARFTATEKKSEKYSAQSKEEKRLLVKNRKIRQNNLCVDCGTLIFKNSKRCQSCATKNVRKYKKWRK